MIDFNDPRSIIESDLQIKKIYFHLRILKEKLESDLEQGINKFNEYINNKEKIETEINNLQFEIEQLNIKRDYIIKELDKLKEAKKRLEALIDKYTPNQLSQKIFVNAIFNFKGVNRKSYLKSLQNELALHNYEINNDIKQISDLSDKEKVILQKITNLNDRLQDGVKNNNINKELRQRINEVNNYIKLVLESMAIND